MIFMQFLVFMKCLSHHPITFFLIFLMWWFKLCMKYSWYYFDIYKWKVIIMNDRMKFDKLISSWFEIFIIWNYACNCFVLWWYMHHEYFIIIHENSDKHFENKCLYHVRWFYILCMMSYSDDWNNDWNALNDECLVSWSTCW